MDSTDGTNTLKYQKTNRCLFNFDCCYLHMSPAWPVCSLGWASFTKSSWLCCWNLKIGVHSNFTLNTIKKNWMEMAILHSWNSAPRAPFFLCQPFWEQSKYQIKQQLKRRTKTYLQQSKAAAATNHKRCHFEAIPRNLCVFLNVWELNLGFSGSNSIIPRSGRFRFPTF